MFSQAQQKHVQELGDRVTAVEAAIEQLRRQVESVGRQLADTPLGSGGGDRATEADRWQLMERRVQTLAETVMALQSQGTPSSASAASAPAPVAEPARYQPPGLIRRTRQPVKLDAAPITWSEPVADPDTTLPPRPTGLRPVTDTVTVLPPGRTGPRPDWVAAPPPDEPDDMDLGDSYAPPPPAVIQEKTVEETLAAVARRIAETVPAEVRAQLQPSLTALEALAAQARTSRGLRDKGEIEVVLRVAANGDVGQRLQEAFEREKAHILGQLAGTESSPAGLDTAMMRDVPALIDVCDSGRRQYDGSQPFYSRIEPWLRQLLSLAGLEAIEPSHGEAYNPSLHNALDLMEADDQRLKDTVESCRYRGYRRQGELLKKAGVIIYR